MGTYILALALAASAAAPQSLKSVYLVRPLYPGQELLARRTEQALDKLFQPAQRELQIMGKAELAQVLQGKSLDLSCVLGDAQCKNPVDAAFQKLGVDWILLVKGGQEESAYRFVVTAYNPATGELLQADAAGPVLEKGLLGALVKVVPLASTVQVDCTVAKATLSVDGERVGQTPYRGQVLPGERKLRLEAEGFEPLEESVVVPARGTLTLRRELTGTPGKLVVNATPAEGVITIDGTSVGKTRVEKTVSPGSHKVRVTLEGYHPWEATVPVKPDGTYTAEVTLEPTTGYVVAQSFKHQRENISRRSSYVDVAFEVTGFSPFNLLPGDAGGTRFGLAAEYGIASGIGGLLLFGPAYYPMQDGTLNNRNENAKFDLIVGRALQPFLRVTVWRFVLAVQAGLEMRAVLQRPSMGYIGDKALPLDLALSGQVRLRAFLWEGLFLDVGYRLAVPLIGMDGAPDASDPSKKRSLGGAQVFNAGVGYAF